MPPSPAASVGQVAEVRVQQGNVEPKDSLPKSGMAWSSAAFLVAVSTIAMLLGMVIYWFTRWRNTEQRTVAVPTATDPVPDKNLEGGAGKVPSETTIGETREVVMPMSFTLTDKMIQLTDVTDQSATISMSKNCAYNNKIYSTCEEVLPRTVLFEAPNLGAAESSDFSKMAQLAKLYAMGKRSPPAGRATVRRFASTKTPRRARGDDCVAAGRRRDGSGTVRSTPTHRRSSVRESRLPSAKSSLESIRDSCVNRFVHATFAVQLIAHALAFERRILGRRNFQLLVSNVASNPVAKHLDISLHRCSNCSFRTYCSFQARTTLLNLSGKIVVNCCPQSRRNDAHSAHRKWLPHVYPPFSTETRKYKL